jgi:hypothetical protein
MPFAIAALVIAQDAVEDGVARVATSILVFVASRAGFDALGSDDHGSVIAPGAAIPSELKLLRPRSQRLAAQRVVAMLDQLRGLLKNHTRDREIAGSLVPAGLLQLAIEPVQKLHARG